jgi:nicotinamide phosphoribosyltransferase
MEKEKFALDNLSFGMGGALLQQLNRDTQKFAMKCSSVKANGAWKDVYKDPVTDHGKRSKRGRLALVDGKLGIATIAEHELNDQKNMLRSVYRDGELLCDDSLNKIRSRV